MHDTLMGDRFLRTAPRVWLDIATGEWTTVEPDVVEAGELERRQNVVHALGEAQEGEVLRVVDAIVRAAGVRACTGIRSIRLAALQMPPASVIDAAARALRSLGFVAVRANVDLPPLIRRQLLHRHVVLFSCDSDASASIGPMANWIRDLSHVSTRAHLVVLLRDRTTWPSSSRSAGSGTVREAPVAGRRGLASRQAEILLARSARLTRRGRHAAAERWTRAAVEAARRRGEVATQEAAATSLVTRLLRDDDWDGGAAAGLRELRRVRDWQTRNALAAATANALIGSGDFPRAEALLQSISVEAAARQEHVAVDVRLRFGQLHFWQGRFEEAAQDLACDVSASAEFSGWRALTRWACGSAEALREARRHLTCGALASAIDVELGLQGEPEADVGARPPPAVTASKRGAPIERALIAWLRTKCGDARPAGQPDATAQWIRARGARGIFRWGLGRGAMNLLHDVTALLQLVHDADDEYTALQHACEWVRQHTPSESAAVVSDGPVRLIAGCGWTNNDLRDEALQSALESRSSRTIMNGSQTTSLSPMRYGGTTIGFAIVRGDRTRSATLGEAALALASACAPALRARLDALSCAAAGQSLSTQILGHSPSMLALREAIARAAVTSFPVLIEGESGTGKELVARALHRLSARRDRTFSPLNCAALTDELAEAELFGHARGAFTGAMNARAGLFEETHGGTLLLDEVSELSARAQAKLLRVLQEREIRRVGEHAARPVDVRVVAATNLPLAEAVARGRFREDLLFRLAVIRVRVPPLRDRIEDVPVLAQSFWRAFMTQTHKRALLAPDAIARLCRHRWSGNVRELQNVIAALVVAAPTRGRVAARHVELILAEDGPAPVAALSLGKARETLERQMIAAALARHAGGRSRAARDLGLSRQGLGKVMKRLGLDCADVCELVS